MEPLDNNDLSKDLLARATQVKQDIITSFRTTLREMDRSVGTSRGAFTPSNYGALEPRVSDLLNELSPQFLVNFNERISKISLFTTSSLEEQAKGIEQIKEEMQDFSLAFTEELQRNPKIMEKVKAFEDATHDLYGTLAGGYVAGDTRASFAAMMVGARMSIDRNYHQGIFASLDNAVTALREADELGTIRGRLQQTPVIKLLDDTDLIQAGVAPEHVATFRADTARQSQLKLLIDAGENVANLRYTVKRHAPDLLPWFESNTALGGLETLRNRAAHPEEYVPPKSVSIVATQERATNALAAFGKHAAAIPELAAPFAQASQALVPSLDIEPTHLTTADIDRSFNYKHLGPAAYMKAHITSAGQWLGIGGNSGIEERKIRKNTVITFTDPDAAKLYNESTRSRMDVAHMRPPTPLAAATDAAPVMQSLAAGKPAAPFLDLSDLAHLSRTGTIVGAGLLASVGIATAIHTKTCMDSVDMLTESVQRTEAENPLLPKTMAHLSLWQKSTTCLGSALPGLGAFALNAVPVINAGTAAYQGQPAEASVRLGESAGFIATVIVPRLAWPIMAASEGARPLMRASGFEVGPGLVETFITNGIAQNEEKHARTQRIADTFIQRIPVSEHPDIGNHFSFAALSRIKTSMHHLATESEALLEGRTPTTLPATERTKYDTILANLKKEDVVLHQKVADFLRVRASNVSTVDGVMASLDRELEGAYSFEAALTKQDKAAVAKQAFEATGQIRSTLTQNAAPVSPADTPVTPIVPTVKSDNVAMK